MERRPGIRPEALTNPSGVRPPCCDLYERSRRRMVAEQLRARGITDRRVLEAMAIVPRHLFVEEALRARAYGDHALPIGEKQTLSQPFTLALMTEALALTGAEKVLDVGSGSGCGSAVLSLLAAKVFCIERISRLASRARRILDSLHASNVVVRVGDGTFGWPEEAPFDAIIASAASPEIPPPLVEQLRPGGRLVMPVERDGGQKLVLLTKKGTGADVKVIGDCRFVKLVGRYASPAGGP